MKVCRYCKVEGCCIPCGDMGFDDVPCRHCGFTAGHDPLCHTLSPPAVPEPVGLSGPPLTREQYRERAERISPSPRTEEPAVPEAATKTLPDGWAVDGEGESRWFHLAGDMPRGMTLAWLRILLATQGLAIVGAKDRAVLEACETIPVQSLKSWAAADPAVNRWCTDVCKAELARREGK